MKTAIHNTLTGTTTIRQLPRIGGKPHPIPAHYIIVQVIDTPAPPYDSAIERLKSEYVLDLEAKTYTLTHEIIQLSDYEIAMRDWLHPHRNFKIKAPKHYARTMPEMVAWFQINNFEIDTESDNYFAYIYINEVLEQDEQLLQLPEIEIFEKPKIQDYD